MPRLNVMGKDGRLVDALFRRIVAKLQMFERDLES